MNPLDQLADIAPPTNVSIWPLAWGYWALIAICLLLIVWAVMSIIKYRARRKAKYHALAIMSSLDPCDEYFAHKMQVALKKVSEHYLPQHKSQMLYGSSWQAFLLSIYQGKNPTQLSKAVARLNAHLYDDVKSTKNAPFSIDNKAAALDDSSDIVAKHNIHTLEAIQDLVKTSFPPNMKTHIKNVKAQHHNEKSQHA